MKRPAFLDQHPRLARIYGYLCFLYLMGTMPVGKTLGQRLALTLKTVGWRFDVLLSILAVWCWRRAYANFTALRFRIKVRVLILKVELRRQRAEVLALADWGRWSARRFGVLRKLHALNQWPLQVRLAAPWRPTATLLRSAFEAVDRLTPEARAFLAVMSPEPPTMPRATRALLWLYTLPYTCMELINSLAAGIHDRLDLYRPWHDAFSRSYELLKMGSFSRPYDPVADEPLVRRARLAVAGVALVMIFLCGAGVLVAPLAVELGRNFGELARACLAGWHK